MYSELLKELIESRKKYFVATCLDAEDTIGYDATQIAQMIEDGIELTHNLFAEMCEIETEHDDIPGAEYGYNESEDTAWVYDPNTDTHYFYR